MALKLYSIMFDGQTKFIEAAGFGHAIKIWHEWAKKEWGDDYDGTEEPESVTLITDEALLRGEYPDAAVDELIATVRETISNYHIAHNALGSSEGPVYIDPNPLRKALDKVEVYCHACSKAGGADRAIRHAPPACA